MKLETLFAELGKEKEEKWDEKALLDEMRMGNGRISVKDKSELTLTDHAERQLSERLGIPHRYYLKMKEEKMWLLDENVNGWTRAKEKNIFIRGMGDRIRAFLSDRYRVIDNEDVLMCAMNELQGKAEAQECDLSDTSMNVKFRCGELKDFVKDRGDEIIGGLLLSNSEVGAGAVNVKPRIFRVQCSNGMVIEQLKTRQIHLGFRGGSEEDDNVYLSIRNSIRDLFDRFGEVVRSLKDSTEITLDDSQRAIENVVKEYNLSDERKNNILMAFGAEPDETQYGLANAITRAGQKEESYENELDFEKLGGEVAMMETSRFKRLVNVNMN